MRLRAALAAIAALVVGVNADAATVGQRLTLQPAARYVAPAPTSAEYLTDSRGGNSEYVGRSSSFGIGHTTGNGYMGWLPSLLDNTILDSNSGHYGASATTSWNGVARLQFPYYDSALYSACATASPHYCASTVGGTATSSAWVYTTTGVASDGKWSQFALGTYTPVNDPANRVVILDTINDDGATGYGGSALPALYSIQNINLQLSALKAANKRVWLLNETPKGLSTLHSESHAVSGGTAQSTYTASFSDGSIFNVVGLIDQKALTWSKVATCTGATRTYTVSSTGLYTPCSGTTTPTNVWLTYEAVGSSSYSTGAYGPVRRDWLSSLSSDFINAGNDYGLAGACNPKAHPNTLCIDIWSALAGSYSATVALHGYLDDGLHPNLTGGYVGAKAMATKILASEPTLTKSLAQAPTLNNWAACRSNGTQFTFSSVTTTACSTGTPGAFPGLMLTNCPTSAGGIQIMVAGVVAAISDGAGSFGSGVNGFTVTASSYSCSTGAWSVTFSAKPSINSVIVVAMDPTNLVLNGLLDTAQPVHGTCPTSFTCSSNLPANWTYSVPTGLATALANGDCATFTWTSSAACMVGSITTTTVTDSDGTWPALQIQFHGILNAAVALQIVNLFTNITPAITPGQATRAGGYSQWGPGADGHLYGAYSVATYSSINATASYTAPWGTAAGTILACRSMDGASTIPADDQLASMAGGVIVQHDLGDLCPTTNMPGISVTQMYWSMGLGPGPVSVTATLWRGQMRVRTQ